MKKKIFSLLLVFVLIMGISMTTMAAEVGVDDAFNSEGMKIPESQYSAMWVGDYIDINIDTYTYEIISGEENVEMDLENETLSFVKEGTTQVEVDSTSDSSEPEIYTFTILPAEEAYVEYQIPQSVKVGFTVGTTPLREADADNAYIYHNCLLGGQRYGSMNSMSDLRSYGFISQGWLDPFFPDPETRTVRGYWSMAFTRPGTTYIEIEGIEGDEPYAITVEEPVINTNLPKRVQTGTKMQMTTSLDNTELKNKKIAEIQNRDIYDMEAALGYQPTVEIVSGAELVERENGDFSNILSSSEDITFTGEGTVTFKVTYEMLPFKEVESGESVAVLDEVYYSPEETFTVEVTSELTADAEIIDRTGDGITTDTSGLDIDSIYENNDLNPAENDVEIVVSQEEESQEDSARLEQAASENGYSVKNVYEILMSVFADGSKVAELTDNFGSLTLSLYVGEDYAGQEAVVYQLHNGTEIITHDGLKVNEDGTVTITVDKLSTFAVAVADTETGSNMTPVSTGTSTSSTIQSVQTGDTARPFLWMALCIGSVGAIAVLMKRKYSEK